MSPFGVAGIVFGCTFAAGLAGLALNRLLPERHVDQASKEVVKLVMGLIATMAALVLGLLVSSAKTNYDTRGDQLHTISSGIIALDRALSHYGPEASHLRDFMRVGLTREVDRIWTANRVDVSQLDLASRDVHLGTFEDQVHALSPRSEAQRVSQARAIQLAEALVATRVQMTQDLGGSIPFQFLLVLCFWLAVLFVGFGMFAQVNTTVVVALLVGAASLAGAIFLILELDQPFDGVMRLSEAPLRQAIGLVGR